MVFVNPSANFNAASCACLALSEGSMACSLSAKLFNTGCIFLRSSSSVRSNPLNSPLCPIAEYLRASFCCC